MVWLIYQAKDIHKSPKKVKLTHDEAKRGRQMLIRAAEFGNQQWIITPYIELC